MRINSIKINHFKSITDMFIDFNDIIGMWQIQGDIGTGKTTIGESILFGLFGTIKGKNNRDIIQWGYNSCEVELNVSISRGTLMIRRTQKNSQKIYVELNGEPLQFNNMYDTQNTLEQEYYDISRLMIESLCIISFNNFQSLATLNGKDTRKFLDDIFGLYILTDYYERIKNYISEEEKKVAGDEKLVSFLASSIESKQNEIANYKPANADSMNKLTVKQTQLKTIKTKWEKLREHQSNRYNNIINDINSSFQYCIAQGKLVTKDLTTLAGGTCPVCGQKVDAGHIHTLEERRTILQSEYKVLKAKIDKVSANRNARLRQYDDTISKYRNEIMNIDREIKGILIEESCNKEALKKDITKLTGQKDECEKNLNSERENCAQWIELREFINKDMREIVLNRYIPIVNHHIQEYLNQLGQPYIIEFDKSFNCTLTAYGMEEPVNIACLSTGQLKLIDTAIILGILRTVVYSSSFNICFLDELFSNMDRDIRDVLCGVIKNNFKGDKSIFIISHAELNDDIFDGKIVSNLDFINGIGTSHYEVKILK